MVWVRVDRKRSVHETWKAKVKLSQTLWEHSHTPADLLAHLVVSAAPPCPTRSPPSAVLSPVPSVAPGKECQLLLQLTMPLRSKAVRAGPRSSWELVCPSRPHAVPTGPAIYSSFRPNTRCGGNSFAQASLTAPNWLGPFSVTNPLCHSEWLCFLGAILTNSSLF